MASDKHNFEELTAPAATAKKLHVSVATLRKYSLIVERVTGRPDYYPRTKQKARLYSKQDVQDLQDFHKLAQENGLTLQEAAQQIFAVSEQNQNSIGGIDSHNQGTMTAPQTMKLLNALQQTIMQQNTALKDLQEQLNRIEAQNKELLEKSNNQEHDLTTYLPDISGIVDNDLDDQKDPESITVAEKRSQIIHDQHKSSEQVHEEILAKAQENAQKSSTSNEYRTLADMQLEPEKSHWWQRFLNL
jgi:DNA-binding transcriptional MerR regulator